MISSPSAMELRQNSTDNFSSPSRPRRMNNPYSASNPTRLVSTPVHSGAAGTTPLSSPTSAAKSPAQQQNVVGMSPVLETLELPATTDNNNNNNAAAAGVTMNNGNNNNKNAIESSSSSSSSGKCSLAVTPAMAPAVAPLTAASMNVTSNANAASSLTVTAAAAGAAPSATNPATTMTPEEMHAELVEREGELTAVARTPNGSSMLQCAIKSSPASAALVWNAFEGAMGDLMLDANAGYVVRALFDVAPRDAAMDVCKKISQDHRLAFSLCTHSLHTRRLVQSVMETHDGDFLSAVLIDRCNEIARTQQGCIVVQRALDHCSATPRVQLIEAITKHLGDFSTDPFGNYVVQYLLDSTPREEAVPLLWSALKGHVLHLSCNKFASNVIEKFLILADTTAQHELIVELYGESDNESLCHVMQDSFGNYIVQATIARSCFGDLQYINNRLRPVLEHVPYGSKIAARLDRRLNPPAHHGGHHHGGHGHGGGHYQHQQQWQQHQQQQQYGGGAQQQQQQHYQQQPRGGRRSYNGGAPVAHHHHQQQHQQQQQQNGPYSSSNTNNASAHHHGHHAANPTTYYVTPSTAAW